SYLMLGAIGTVSLLAVAIVFGSFGQSTLRPALTSLITHAAGRHEQGIVLGLTQSLMSVAQIIAPPLGGWLIGNDMLAVWALLAGTPALLGVVAARWGSARAEPLRRAVASN